jgi:DNA ligase 1
MKYSEFVDVYESLGKTTKRLEKTEILAKFYRKFAKGKGDDEWVYLLHGRVLPDWDSKEFGISGQLVIKAISKSFGISTDKIVEKFRKVGDLGNVAEEFSEKKKQGTLFGSKLSVKKVFDNLKKLTEIEGRGSVDRKMGLISELLGNAEGKEAKYIVRTLLNDLRIGVAEGVLRDGLAEAFFKGDGEMKEKVGGAYDLANDYAEVFREARKGKKALEKIGIVPGKPLKVMLPVKVTELKEAFRICAGEDGKVAVEHKYDGFRMLVHKDEKKVWLFTRKLENVTKQFPDVVEIVKRRVKGKNFILDSEAVGFDFKTGRPRPFEAISQRIRRKYHIDKLIKELPVELTVFDILYLNGKEIIKDKFVKRRELLEKIVDVKKKEIRLSEQIITSKVKEVEEFYRGALKAGEEGIMIKSLDSPYKPGRLVGHIVKMKPEVKDLDLVVVGAEYGTGKRAGGLTSYIVACLDGESGKYLEVGRVASGLKEKKEEGFSYGEMDKLLQPLIISSDGRMVKVKPKIVVSITYQNIQKSPNYDSGWAMRFPRITNYRPDKPLKEITTLKEIKKDAKITSLGKASKGLG